MRNVKKMCRRNHLKLHHLCSLCVGNEDVYKLFIEIVFYECNNFSKITTICIVPLDNIYNKSLITG